MTIANLFTDARSVLTVVSLLTFLGIIFWSYSGRRAAAYAEAANLPFADDVDDTSAIGEEKRHG